MKNVSAILFCVSSFAAMVSSTVLELNTDSEGFFVLSYTRVGRESDAPSTARIMITPERNPPRWGDPVGGFINITGIANEHIITRGFVRTNDLIRATFRYFASRPAEIDVGFETDFAQFATTYMMIPVNGQLVINPVNPEDFVYNGSWVTTNSTNGWFPQVGISVSILNTTRGEDGAYVPSTTIRSHANDNFVLETEELKDSIPRSIRDSLCTEFLRRQIPIRGEAVFHGINYYIDGDLDDEVIDTFPIIQYRIHTDSGANAIIQLHGKDYIGPFVNHRRELLFREGYHYSLARNTLSKIALFVDNANRILGFGDPL